MTLGGKREGAGRKPDRGERKQSLTVRLTPELLAFFADQESSAADAIEDCVRRSKAFREWLAARK